MNPDTIIGWCIAALAVLTALMFVVVLLFGIGYVVSIIREEMRDKK